MGQNPKINFFSDLNFQQVMVDDISPFHDSSNQLQQQIFEQNQNKLTGSKSSTNPDVKKRKCPVSSSVSFQPITLKYTLDEDHLENKFNIKVQPKKKSKSQNSKKYRQKRRQQIRQLQEQNRYLKFKNQQLFFRLNQAQIQINKLKNGVQAQTKSFHQMKEQSLRQIQKAINNNQKDIKKILEVQQKFNNLNALNGKQRLDLLNYFMSQILQNVINDVTFYFLDNHINKKGIYRLNQSTPMRKIDNQVISILQIQQVEKQNFIKSRVNHFMEIESKKLQQLWKKLYQVYLDILNQGSKLQRLIGPVKEDLRKIIHPLNFLKLEWHFQKIKHRYDLRQIRSSWFLDLQKQNQCVLIQNSELKKKTKLFQS